MTVSLRVNASQCSSEIDSALLLFRALREEFYRAYITRASSGESDNTPLIERTLALKQEQAQLLGYPNYAEVSLASKVLPAYLQCILVANVNSSIQYMPRSPRPPRCFPWCLRYFTPRAKIPNTSYQHA